MQLHTFRASIKRKRSHRVGRGGKRGTFSGRGTKGQKSRAGRVIRPAQRDLILRIPKRRGFRNKPTGEKSFVVNLSDLAAFTGTVDRAVLEKAGIVKGVRKSAKILGSGNIAHPLTIVGLKVSKSARMKIEKAGGEVKA